MWLLIALAVAIFVVGTTLSYYVDALWYGSLGYRAVFWTRLNLQVGIFVAFALFTFLAIYGSFLALKPSRLDELLSATILINGQRVKLPLERILDLIALGVALAFGVVVGASMMARWTTLALFWSAPRSPTALDPVFGRPLSFYLFTLPSWQLLTGWLLTLAIIACLIAVAFIVVAGDARVADERRLATVQTKSWRGMSIALAVLLLMIAGRVYLGRFERLFQDGAIFAGVTYTDAHVTLVGMLAVCLALIVGAAMAGLWAFLPLGRRWLAVTVIPAIVCYLIVAAVGWLVSSFVVKPNQLVRERPYIVRNIEMTRQAYALDRIEPHSFPADSDIEALDPTHNQTTLENIRLWDSRALQDTLRQIQEIRTYYDFPISTSIDIRSTASYTR